MLRMFTCAMCCCCCGAGPGPLLRRCPWGPLPWGPPFGGPPPPPPRRLPPPLLTPLMPLLALLARWAITCCCGGGPCWDCCGWGCGGPGRPPSTRPSPCRGPVRTMSDSMRLPVSYRDERILGEPAAPATVKQFSHAPSVQVLNALPPVAVDITSHRPGNKGDWSQSQSRRPVPEDHDNCESKLMVDQA